MMKKIVLLGLFWGLVLVMAGLIAKNVTAQNPSGLPSGQPGIQLLNPAVVPFALSATNIVKTQTVLTVPAPAGGLFNYICSVKYKISTSAAGPAAITNLAWTTSNFYSYGGKVSVPATVNYDTGVQTLFDMDPGFGCAKSAAAGTATVFTSPTGATYGMWDWQVKGYVGP